MHYHPISVSSIEKITGLPRHKINHALNRFGPPPRGRIGINRVWAPDDLPAILEAIARTTGLSVEVPEGADHA